MDNNLVLVKCSDIMSDHNVKLAGHIQNLVGQCPMTDCYFQPGQLQATRHMISNRQINVRTQWEQQHNERSIKE